MDMETGLLDWSLLSEVTSESKDSGLLPPSSEETIKEALERICEITGCKKRTLKKPEMGPRANPARRFAVWALWSTRLLTHRQIGNALEMTTVHVSKQLSRMNKKFPGALKKWRKEWEKDE
jgi:hypothetical protein